MKSDSQMAGFVPSSQFCPAALEFFYPRLLAGGYFFLHDFNNNEYDWAVRRAATKFMRGKPERIVEIPDRRGTALFRKI
jgi:O-methyltransferase